MCTREGSTQVLSDCPRCLARVILQSRERGITLDLGFSAFTVPVPDHLPTDKYNHLQFTLVSPRALAFCVLS